ncbi:hypothetical protein RRG08_066595 [Elysia crispata]|uniref:Uncharacterized protein n=1 Tax=Elysia crispata TaxID=231223 RepID=A0AAE0XW21_9GAST|nr:hypothetical protein RRG08_066595 [Elysia crispata]
MSVWIKTTKITRISPGFRWNFRSITTRVIPICDLSYTSLFVPPASNQTYSMSTTTMTKLEQSRAEEVKPSTHPPIMATSGSAKTTIDLDPTRSTV